MTKLFVCTGKKKKVNEVIGYFTKLKKAQKIDLLSLKVKTKKALFWSYDEMRLLYDEKAGSVSPPDKLLSGLDYHDWREQSQILLEFQSPTSEDKMIKVKILTTCHIFVGKGVRSKITLHEKKETEYRIYYHCVGQLNGPIQSVMDCKNQLVNENLCDPDKISYVF